MSSTYLNHILDGLVAVLMAMISILSMNRLATTGLMGKPTVAPCTCSKYLLQKRKYVFIRKNSDNVVISCTDMEFLLYSSVSCSNLFLMMEKAGSTGINVSPSDGFDLFH